MIRKLRRLYYRIVTFRDYGRVLNQCATVEQALLNAAQSDERPDRQQCLEWARILGGVNVPRT